ncbi:bromo adjacent homology domain-containing 1 protein [Pseudorasbora parva]|uniref:bromo adjacent homology domain-containing 1 protein n=1 Tax=Pseudorasbora parva TaxID=51549 RepID=UPI00351E8755
MTHARKKGSLSQYRGEGWSHGDAVGGACSEGWSHGGDVGGACSEGWSHGNTVGGAWPAHSPREGKARKASRIQEHTESRKDSKSPVKMDVSEKGKRERHRKLYPLRGRPVASDGEPLSCHVLLTRLDDPEEESKPGKARKTPKSTDNPSAPEPRKRRLASLNAEAVNSLLLEKPAGKTTDQSKKPDGPEQAKSSKRARKAEKQTRKAGSEPSLYTPAPRRLAGLTAATLLKLTSSTHTHRTRADTHSPHTHRTRAETHSTHTHRTRADTHSPHTHRPRADTHSTHTHRTRADTHSTHTHRPRADTHSTHTHRPRADTHSTHTVHGRARAQTKPSRKKCEVCEACRSWSVESKPGFRSLLGYPVQMVKEEPGQELTPFCCCPLALFLGPDADPPAVKHHECLVPAHPALALRAHPCLCADPCYSGYYVHIAPGLGTHGPFCSGASGVPHPAFCGSVSSACFHQACGLRGYAFSQSCSFPCSNCSHPVKTEGFAPSQDEHSRSLLVPPALPLSGCPSMPRINTSSPLDPHLLSSISDHRQAKVRLKVGKECPQNTKPSSSSLTMGQTKISKQPATSPASAKNQRRVSRQPTNGWRPVGDPTEKEVFIAGDEETVLRQCYEGVERDGEVIRVRDTVLLRSGPRKKSLPYVAKISALWEDPRTGELMMSLFWYYRPEHTQGGRDPSMHCENEIFASRHQDENSVACIEDRCYVLPLAQYCRFCALVKRRSEGVSESPPVVPVSSASAIPSHRHVPDGVDPELVYLCRHVYDFRYGRILKNLQ